MSNLKIFDTTGRLIHVQKTNADVLNIDVSAFVHGMYILKVEIGGAYWIRKFVVTDN